MEIEHIELIHLQLVKFINKIEPNIDDRNAFIINLPSLILDIQDLSLISENQTLKKKWLIDRPLYGFYEKTFLGYLKKIAKKFFINILRPNIYYPLFYRSNSFINKLVVDAKFKSLDKREWEKKDLTSLNFSSVSYIFDGKYIKLDNSNKSLELVEKCIDNISRLTFLFEIYNLNKDKIKLLKRKLYISQLSVIFRINQARKFLPINLNEIYLPTLYSPFNRILAIIARERNCRVISFDHGTGIAFTNCLVSANIELDLSDEFITMSNLHKLLLIKLLSNDFRTTKNTKTLIYSSSNKKYFACENNNSDKIRNTNKLLYITSVISNSPHIPPILSPSSYIQLQLSILQQLSKIKGYSLHLREHPETEFNMPNLIIDQLNVQLISKRVESLKNQYLYIIDYPQTTCLRYAIERNIPLIVIFPKKGLINEKVIAKLKSSPNCRLINLSVLKDKSLFINENQILDAIQSLKVSYDKDFVSDLF